MAKNFYRIDGRTRIILICLVLTSMVLAVFAQVRSHEFINYDDPAYVTGNNAVLNGLSADSILWAFTTGCFGNWNPLTWISYMLDRQFFGSGPAGFHLTNLILHIANALILFIVLKQMTNAVWQSAFVAALFAIHPLHVESVAWISGRKDVLSTFFALLTMAAYLRYVKKPGIARYLPALLLFALGLMAKPMIVTLPFAFLLLDYWPLNRIRNFSGQNIYRLILEKVPFLVLSVAAGVVTYYTQKNIGALPSFAGMPLKYRILNALISYAKYIGKMFIPTGLAPFYPHPREDVSILYALISAIILLAITIVVLYFVKNRRYLLTGWFWYLGTLIPVLGIIQIGSHAMADRYTYVPLIGLFIMVSFGGAELFGKLRYGIRISAVSAAVIIFALMICTYRQVGFWRNSITLFEHTAQVTQNNYLAYSNLSNALGQKGDYDAAIKNGLESLRIRPNYDTPCYNLGMAYYSKGDTEKAIYYWTEALKINPKFPEANYALATALLNKNEVAQAIKYLQEELKINPNHTGAKKLLSKLISATR
ncbi:MAG: tetratricopeptide repeat protein [Sedimentisphaerales bacterium]